MSANFQAVPHVEELTQFLRSKPFLISDHTVDPCFRNPKINLGEHVGGARTLLAFALLCRGTVPCVLSQRPVFDLAKRL